MNATNNGYNVLASDDAESRSIPRIQQEERILGSFLKQKDALAEPFGGTAAHKVDSLSCNVEKQAAKYSISRPKRTNGVIDRSYHTRKQSRHVSNMQASSSFKIVRPWHVVLGDTRLDRTTVATKMLQKIKESYQQKHKGEKTRSSWSSEAVQAFEKRMDETFPTKQQRGSVLVKCTRQQLNTLKAEGGRLLFPQFYGYLGDKTPSYVLAKKQESLRHFFEHLDPLTLEEKLNRLRNDTEKLKNNRCFHPKSMLDDFEDTLQFFERKCQMAQQGMKMSQKFLRCIDPMRILQEQWKMLNDPKRTSPKESSAPVRTNTKPNQQGPSKSKSDPLFALSMHTMVASNVSNRLTQDKTNKKVPKSTPIPRIVTIPMKGSPAPPVRRWSTSSMSRRIVRTHKGRFPNDDDLAALSTHAHVDLVSPHKASLSIPLMVDIRQHHPSLASERKRAREPEETAPIPTVRTELYKGLDRRVGPLKKHGSVPSTTVHPYSAKELHCPGEIEMQDLSDGESVVVFEVEKSTSANGGRTSLGEQMHFFDRHVDRSLGVYCGRRLRPNEDESKRSSRSLVPPSRMKSSHNAKWTWHTRESFQILWDRVAEDGWTWCDEDSTRPLLPKNYMNSSTPTDSSESLKSQEGVVNRGVADAHIPFTEERLIHEAERAIEWLLSNEKSPKVGGIEDITTRAQTVAISDCDDGSSSKDSSLHGQATDEESTFAYTLLTESNEGGQAVEYTTTEFEQELEGYTRLDELHNHPALPSSNYDMNTVLRMEDDNDRDGSDEASVESHLARTIDSFKTKEKKEVTGNTFMTPEAKSSGGTSPPRRRDQKDSFVYHPPRKLLKCPALELPAAPTL